MNSDIESLMSQYLDGRMSPGEAAELSRILIENPEAAARFAELTRVDEGLRVALKAESRSEIFAARLRSKSKADSETAKTTAPDRRRWLAAAAGLAVLGGTAWWFTRDHTVPTVVMDWAKSRVKRSPGNSGNGDDSGSLGSADLRASLPVDEAATLRRKLRNFAIPYLHMRSMPVSDALNTLALQWTSLPHVKAEDAEKVKISLADSVRKRWPTTDKEPVVSVDIPNLSLHTALNLVAAQAGLKMDVTADSITLLPDESSAKAAPLASADAKPEELKTWTFPLTKPVADSFLASLNQRQQASDASSSSLAGGRAWAAQPDSSAGAAHYNFSYAWQKNPPASIAGVAGAGPASDTPSANLELSFRVADVVADVIRQNETAALNDAAALYAVKAASARTENVEGALDQAVSGTVLTDEVLLESTLQDQASPELPSLAATDIVIKAKPPVEILSFDTISPTEGTVADGDPAVNQAHSYYLAETDAGPRTVTLGVEAGTFMGVRSDSSAQSAPPVATTTGQAQVTVAMLSAAENDRKVLSDSWLEGKAADTDKLGKPVTFTTRFVQDPRWVNASTLFITQPPATLDTWLTGLSGGGSLAHDTENNVLSVTGTASELRTASAAMAALTESVQWGVSLDARYIELGDLPAPELNRAGNSPTLSADQVEKLCKAANTTPGSACARLPMTLGPLEKPIRLSIKNGTAKTIADGLSSSEEHKLKLVLGDAPGTPQLLLDASVTAAKQGERWTLTTGLKDGASELNNKASLMDGSWLVIESTNGRYLLLRPRSANVTQ